MNSRSNRTYLLEVNPKILKHSLSDEALMSILLHEFSHIHDFTYLTRTQLVQIGFAYLTHPHSNHVASYEKATDEIAIMKGAGSGLIEYRHWLYSTLSEKDVKLKQKLYLKPEEIKSYMERLPDLIEAPQADSKTELSNARKIRKLFSLF